MVCVCACVRACVDMHMYIHVYLYLCVHDGCTSRESAEFRIAELRQLLDETFKQFVEEDDDDDDDDELDGIEEVAQL